MKVKATQEAWYKKSKIQEGQIVEYEGVGIPCWATLASGEDTAGEYDEEGKDDTEGDSKPDKTEDDAQEIQNLEKLRDLAVENDIWADVPKDATVKEETNLLKKLFQQHNITLHI